MKPVNGKKQAPDDEASDSAGKASISQRITSDCAGMFHNMNILSCLLKGGDKYIAAVPARYLAVISLPLGR